MLCSDCIDGAGQGLDTLNDFAVIWGLIDLDEQDGLVKWCFSKSWIFYMLRTELRKTIKDWESDSGVWEDVGCFALSLLYLYTVGENSIVLCEVLNCPRWT